MNERKDYVALEWVSREIEETLKQSRQALENHVADPADSAQLQFCRNYIHQVHATLRMLEFPGPLLFGQEMEALATAIADDAVADREAAYEALMGSMLRMPLYLGQVKSERSDVPGVLKVAVDEMRRARQATPFEANELFAPRLRQPVRSQEQGEELSAVEFETLVKKLRQLFQAAFVDIVRNKRWGNNVRQLAQVCQRLRLLSKGKPREAFWTTALATLEGLVNRTIPANAVAKILLKEVDKELKSLLAVGPQLLQRPVDEDVLRALLYYIAKSDAQSPLITEVQALYGLKQSFIPVREDDTRVLRDSEAMRTALKVLLEEISRVKDVIDIFERSGNRSMEQLEAAGPLYRRIADTLSMLSLQDLLASTRQQEGALAAYVAGGRPDDSSPLQSVANGLVAVENSIQQLVDSLSVTVDSNESPAVVSARKRVIKESRNILELAKQATVDYVASHWDPAAISKVPSLLRNIRGGLTMAGLTRAAGLLERVQSYIEAELLAGNAAPDWQHIDGMADAITSVDYYLERLETGNLAENDYLLDEAATCLRKLGYSEQPAPAAAVAVPVTLPEAPVLEAVPEEIPPEMAAEVPAEARAAVAVQSEPAAQPAPVSQVVPLFPRAVESRPEAAAATATASSLIDQEIVDIFLEEVEEVLGTIRHFLPIWKNGEDDEGLVEVRRGFHTLKGSGRTVGARDLGEVAWAVENMLNRVIDKTVPADPQRVLFVETVVSLLPRLVGAFRDGRQADQDLCAQIESLGTRLASDDAQLLDDIRKLASVVVAPAAVAAGGEAEEQDEAAALLEVFEAEARTHVATIDNYVRRAHETGIPRTLGEDIHRALHTLKGGANIAGLTNLVNVVTPVEKLIKHLQMSQARLEPDVIDILEQMSAYFREELSCLKDGRHARFEGVDNFLRQVDWLHHGSEVEHMREDVDVATRHGQFVADAARRLAELESALVEWKAAARGADFVERAVENLEHIATGAQDFNYPTIVDLAGALTVALSSLAAAPTRLEGRAAALVEDAIEGLVGMLDCVVAGLDVAPWPVERLEAITALGLAPADAEAAVRAREEAERVEQERLAREAAERAEQERREREEAERVEQERLVRERELAALAEQERLAREREEAERAEQERLAREREEAERAEQERLAREAAERAEQERLAREREEAERAEQERLARELEEAERAEQERLAREREEAERAEQERLAREREEAERAEQERLAREREEAERAEQERREREEAERVEQERLVRERELAAQAEQQRLAKAREVAQFADEARLLARQRADEAARVRAEQESRERAEAFAHAARLRVEREQQLAAKQAELEESARQREALASQALVPVQVSAAQAEIDARIAQETWERMEAERRELAQRLSEHPAAVAQRGSAEIRAAAVHLAREHAAQQAHDQEIREVELREQAEREARERADQEAREQAEREARERAELEARERAEREARERADQEAREQAEREARERAELEAREQAEREARERAEQEAREQAEREAREQAEREAREQTEREARERAEQELRAQAEREARERAEQEARERADQLVREQAAGLQQDVAAGTSEPPAATVYSLGEDVDPEILEIFLEEAGDMLETTDEVIGRWQDNPASSDCLDQYLRFLHTLKGGARMAGLYQLGDATHELETELQGVTPADFARDNGLLGRIQYFQDQLLRLVNQIGSGGPITINLMDAVHGRSAPPPVAPSREPAPPAMPPVETPAPLASNVVPIDRARAGSTPVPAAPAVAVPAAAAGSAGPQLTEPMQARPPQEMIKIPTRLMESLVNLAGETSISRARVEQQMSEVSSALLEMDITIDRMLEQVRRLEIETEAQILFRQEQVEQAGMEEFDPLEMDRYSALQQLTRSLTESASDIRDIKGTISDKERDIETLLLQQSRINTDLQEGLMRSRMVRFARLVPRLRRIVRQLATELGKEVELEFGDISGEMDRSLLERMLAPFEHMLRNAIDHGIEPTPVRLARGKPAVGLITIDMAREGGDVVITLQDDGGGIDLAAVRNKAIAMGLMDDQATLTDREIMQFIFSSGFSTAAAVTQISGRGVGMDVVNSEVRQMGGSIDIDSEPGVGTEFEVRLPFTVSVNRALMVSICGDMFALPLNTIEGIVRVSPFELEAYYQPDAPGFEYGGQSYRLRYMGVYLHKAERPNLEGLTSPLPVVLVRSSDHAVAVQVDAVLGSQEVVVKSLGLQFNAVPGLAGATVMGDGSVVVILDLLSMIRAEASHGRREQLVSTGQRAREARRNMLVMVVDDSVTVRKVAARFLERNGMDVLVAKDGLEAMQLLQVHKPDVMLLDIEMPRMDGFEVAERVKRSQHLKDITIIMITSRTGEKHRERAMSLGVEYYLGKPYQENELLALLKEVEELVG